MKKKYLFIKGARTWNKLLQKFNKTYKKIQFLLQSNNLSKQEYQRLSAKLNRIFKRLENLQSNVGLKLAGTSLVLMLSVVSSQAQDFRFTSFLQEHRDATTDFKVNDKLNIDLFDIDQDGDLDIIAGESYGKLHILINDGSGTYVRQSFLKADDKIIQLEEGFPAPHFTDIDGDGDLDLLVGVDYGNVYWYKNNGNNNFTLQGLIQADGSDLAVGSGAQIASADFDQDGDMDLYIGNTTGVVQVFTNDGSGNFSAQANLQADDSEINLDNSSPIFVDIDADNDLDLYIGKLDGTVSVYTNDGLNNFSLDGNLQADGVELDVSNSAVPVFTDIDNDGDLDLYIGNSYGNIKTFINDGAGNFSSEGNLKVEGNFPIEAQWLSTPKFADIDNDGDLELYIGDWYRILVYEDNGNGTYSRIDTLQADGIDIEMTYASPEFADIDNDGDLDLYVGGFYEGIKVYLNDGSGNFSANGGIVADGNLTAIDEPTPSPEFADIDGDGDLDLYVGINSGYINVYTNDGSGVFSSNGLFQADGASIGGNYAATPEFADIDNDGDIDLLVGNYYDDIKLFVNDGSNNFTSSGNLTIQNNLNLHFSDVETIDLDNDGDLDIVSGGSYGMLRFFESLLVTKFLNQPTEVTNICANETVNFSIVAESADAYQWQLSTDGGTNFSDISDNADFTGTQTADLAVISGVSTEGMYRCVISNTNNTAESDAVALTLESELPTITCVGNQTIDLPAGETQYTVSGTEFDPTSTSDNCTVASVENDFNSANSLDGELLPVGTTIVEWAVTDDAGNIELCSFEIQISSTTNISEISENIFNIYPNPAKEILTISNVEYVNNDIQILDISGKIVKTVVANKTEQSIDISELQNGIYFIKIGTQVQKFIKE